MMEGILLSSLVLRTKPR